MFYNAWFRIVFIPSTKVLKILILLLFLTIFCDHVIRTPGRRNVASKYVLQNVYINKVQKIVKNNKRMRLSCFEH